MADFVGDTYIHYEVTVGEITVYILGDYYAEGEEREAERERLTTYIT